MKILKSHFTEGCQLGTSCCHGNPGSAQAVHSSAMEFWNILWLQVTLAL